jgi:2-desacetyl-2-hydroxyethyl bacteriochlorophyllide A dehydrogenase
MGWIIQLDEPRAVTVSHAVDEEPGPGQVRVQTLYSGISAGSELTQYRGSNPYLIRQWNSEHRLFVDGAPAATYPFTAWGYEEVGRVDLLGSGVEAVRRGDLVWGAWQHRSSAIVDADSAAAHRLPSEIPPLRAVFARISAIALNAVFDAGIQLGETVAVFGLGIPGLIALQLAQLSGARVVAVDRVAKRLAMAGELGAAHCVDVTAEDAGQAIRAITDGRGADVSIELTGSYLGLHEAVRATAYNSRVVCSGFLQGEGVGLRLGEEFHHNRIAIICSQISGLRPDIAHRWSRERLEATVMDLLGHGRLEVDPLISHVVPARRAAEAFALLDVGDPDVLQIVLDFTDRWPATGLDDVEDP